MALIIQPLYLVLNDLYLTLDEAKKIGGDIREEPQLRYVLIEKETFVNYMKNSELGESFIPSTEASMLFKTFIEAENERLECL